MTAKEYLMQFRMIEQRIKADEAELERLRLLSVSLTSPRYGVKVRTTPSQDPPFAGYVHRINELENRIGGEIDLLLSLWEQMRGVIETVKDVDERLVLKRRYILNETWERIGEELSADKSTIRRWHGNALAHLEVPPEPVLIKE